MKKTKTILSLNFDVVCPYCNSELKYDIGDFQNYKIDCPVEVEHLESLLRGIVRRFSYGEGLIGDLPIKCKKCKKNFVINEILY